MPLADIQCSKSKQFSQQKGPYAIPLADIHCNEFKQLSQQKVVGLNPICYVSTLCLTPKICLTVFTTIQHSPALKRKIVDLQMSNFGPRGPLFCIVQFHP